MKPKLPPKNLKRLIIAMRLASVAFLVAGGIGLLSSAVPIIWAELKFEVDQRIEAANDDTVQVTQAPEDVSFGEVLLIPPELKVTPVNTTNSIIIEKIDVNDPIVWDVDVMDRNAYNNALKKGVAHAYGSPYPSDKPGNTYLFAHSTLNPLEIEKYSATFTLLHRLSKGDKITIFKDDKRYDYIIENVEIVDKFNTTPLTRDPDYPMLTLQTCDPPGVPLNRLIVTARLVAVY